VPGALVLIHPPQLFIEAHDVRNKKHQTSPTTWSALLNFEKLLTIDKLAITFPKL
jgi:hypothetical protein